MIWVAWRRQRTETLIALRLLALLARCPRADRAPHGVRSTTATASRACLGHAGRRLRRARSDVHDALRLAQQPHRWMNFVPGLIGVLLAAPFVLELEQARTGSPGRRASPAGVDRRQARRSPSPCALAAALVFTLLLTWWRAPLVRAQRPHGQRASSTRRASSSSATRCSRSGSRRRSASSGGAQSRRSSSASSATSRPASSSTPGCGSGSCRRSRARGVYWPPEPASLRHALILDEYPSDRFGHHVRIPFDVCGAGGRC